MPTIHEFYNSSEAYDASQCYPEIKDGDILVTPEDIAILFKAWPVSIRETLPAESKFHGWERGKDWLSDNPDVAPYLDAYLIASQIH
jgi:hypothetical protein